MDMVPPEGELVFRIDPADYETYRVAGWREATEAEVISWAHLGPDGTFSAATGQVIAPEAAG